MIFFIIFFSFTLQNIIESMEKDDDIKKISKNIYLKKESKYYLTCEKISDGSGWVNENAKKKYKEWSLEELEEINSFISRNDMKIDPINLNNGIIAFLENLNFTTNSQLWIGCAYINEPLLDKKKNIITNSQDIISIIGLITSKDSPINTHIGYSKSFGLLKRKKYILHKYNKYKSMYKNVCEKLNKFISKSVLKDKSEKKEKLPIYMITSPSVEMKYYLSKEFHGKKGFYLYDTKKDIIMKDFTNEYISNNYKDLNNFNKILEDFQKYKLILENYEKNISNSMDLKTKKYNYKKIIKEIGLADIDRMENDYDIFITFINSIFESSNILIEEMYEKYKFIFDKKLDEKNWIPSKNYSPLHVTSNLSYKIFDKFLKKAIFSMEKNKIYAWGEEVSTEKYDWLINHKYMKNYPEGEYLSNKMIMDIDLFL